MKKFICILVVTIVLALSIGTYVCNNWTKITAKNGVWVDWSETWTFDGAILYYGEVYNTGETICRWLPETTWKLIIEARGYGLMASPL